MHSQSEAAAEMPRYKCHKEVWALKIKAVEVRKPTIAELDRILSGKAADGDSGAAAFLTPENALYGRIEVDQEYVSKHKPEAGGYFVVYADGYKSFSPAKAFEDGYTRV
jgi:hypothetical protein